MTGRRSKPPHGLPEEDIALWQMVAERIGPAKGKPRVTDVDMDERRLPDRHPSAARGTHTPVVATGHAKPVHSKPTHSKPVDWGHAPGHQTASSHSTGPPSPAKTKIGNQPKPVVLERRKARRIARGSEEIEARLDLHGMTQDDAHATLTGFIRRCHAAGLRTVLVITGKGSQARDHSEDHFDLWHRPRGVLKRNVPIWLSQPALAPLVVSWSTAHVRHGGEGALYVQIRVKR